MKTNKILLGLLLFLFSSIYIAEAYIDVSCLDYNPKDECNRSYGIRAHDCEVILLDYTAWNEDDENPCHLNFRFIIDENAFSINRWSHDFQRIGYNSNGESIYEVQLDFAPDEEKYIYIVVEPSLLSHKRKILAEWDDCENLTGNFESGFTVHFQPTSQIGTDANSVTRLSDVPIREHDEFREDAILWWGDAEIYPQNIRVFGTLIIDIPYTVIGNIFMENHAKIIVNRGVHFKILGQKNDLGEFVKRTSVSPCGYKLWNTIEVQNSAILEVSYAQITDGDKAISGLEGANIFVNQTIFCDDFYGIYATGSSLVSVTSSIFSTALPIKNDPILTGIYLDEVSKALVTGGENSSCMFINVVNGITSLNSSLYIYDSYFNELLNEFVHNPVNRVSVYAEGPKGTTFIDLSRFSQCKIAVWNNDKALSFYNSLIKEGVHTGIKLENIRRSRTKIFDSRIEATQTGVQINNCRTPTKLKRNAIVITQPTNPSFSGGVISNGSILVDCADNDISLINGASLGVQYTDCAVSNIRKNEVILESSAPDFRGFTLNGCRSIKVGCNYAQGTAGESNSFGYLLNQSVGSHVYCNAVASVEAGYNTIEANTGTDFKGNAMMGCYGLEIQVNSFIDPQKHKGNCWNPGPYPCESAINYNSSLTLVRKSKFLVNDEDSDASCALLPDNPVDLAGSGDWFKNKSGVTQAGCYNPATSCTEAVTGGNPDDPDVIYREQIVGLEGFTNFVTERQWTAKYQLYQYVSEGNISTQENPVIDSFMQAESQTAMGRFVAVEQLYRLLGDTGSTEFQELATIQGDIDVLSIDMINLSASLENALTPEQWNQMEAWSTQSQSLQNQAEGYNATISSSRQALIDQMRTINQSISPQSDVESYLKDVNRIWIDLLDAVGAAPVPADVSTLQSIAARCPGEAGPAVWRARALLQSLGTSPDWDDSGCNGNNGQRRAAHKKTIAYDVQLSPNPATGLLNISLSTRLSSGYWVVLNSSGITIDRGIWKEQSSSIQLSTAKLPSGLYFFRIESEEMPAPIIRKFVIK